jgi:hypothetical protein
MTYQCNMLYVLVVVLLALGKLTGTTGDPPEFMFVFLSLVLTRPSSWWRSLG